MTHSCHRQNLTVPAANRGAITKQRNVVAFDLTPVTAKRLLNTVASDSGRVFFTPHAELKMRKRHITRTQVLRCLSHGRIVEGPSRDIKGNWSMKLEVCSAGQLVSVVAALDRDTSGEMIIVITAY